MSSYTAGGRDAATAQRDKEWKRRGWEDGWRAGWNAAWTENLRGDGASFGQEHTPETQRDEGNQDDEDEDDMLVLNPEWAARFAETERKRARHKEKEGIAGVRRPRKAKRQRSSEAEEGKDLDGPNREFSQDHLAENDTVFPGAEKARTREKERLERYGREGAKLVADVEGAMNAKYHMEMDRRNIHVWPVLPLR